MRTPKPLPPCVDCGAPSIQRRWNQQPRCARCAAIARDIANQKGAAMVAAIRKLDAEHTKQEAA